MCVCACVCLCVCVFSRRGLFLGAQLVHVRLPGLPPIILSEPQRPARPAATAAAVAGRAGPMLVLAEPEQVQPEGEARGPVGGAPRAAARHRQHAAAVLGGSGGGGGAGGRDGGRRLLGRARGRLGPGVGGVVQPELVVQPLDCAVGGRRRRGRLLDLLGQVHVARVRGLGGGAQLGGVGRIYRRPGPSVSLVSRSTGYGSGLAHERVFHFWIDIIVPGDLSGVPPSCP